MQLIGISTAHCFGRCQINLVVWDDIWQFGVINRGFWRLTIEWWYEGSPPGSRAATQASVQREALNIGLSGGSRPRRTALIPPLNS